ncbi:MAG: hypothetical protein QM535_22730 [Limnohabitans sp.]|nr:hypothetical protein [Limnohabitans sp.]
MKKKINLLIALAINCLVSQAQQNNGIAPFFQNNMYGFNTLQKIELHNFFNNYRTDLGTTTDDSFAVQHINYLADKKFDCRYLQYHKGYLVDGTSFVLHGESNVVLHAAGNQIKNMNVNVSSPISEPTALANVISHFSGYTFDYQVDSILANLQEAYDDSTYVSMMWWLWSSVNFDDTKNQSIAATIAHWGKCSKEHKAVVRAWAAVGLGSTYVPDCRLVWLSGDHVINQVELVTKQPKFKLNQSTDEPPAPINPETIDWIIPSGWNTSISPDKTELTVHSIASTDSKELKAVISNGNNTFDTLKHVVHVVNYLDTASNNNPAAFMRKAIENESSITKSSQFLIYPNPGHDLVNIFIGDEEANLEIFNMVGVKMRSMHLKKAMNNPLCI